MGHPAFHLKYKNKGHFECHPSLKRLVVGDAVGHDEPLPILDVKITHGCELLRAGRVEDLEDARRVVHLDLLAVKVLDRRVVLLHEETRHKLHRERGLADAARTQHHHFELSHLATVCAMMTMMVMKRRIHSSTW